MFVVSRMPGQGAGCGSKLLTLLKPTMIPFAAYIRHSLQKKGVSSGLTVVFSDELAKESSLALTDQRDKKT